MDAIETKKDMKASNSKIWLFRLLVVAAAAVMLAAWFMPWWTMDIDGFGYDSAQIRPWGLVISERLAVYKVMMRGAELPGWFSAAMWSYLALCMIALLVGMFVHGPEFRYKKIKFSLSQLLVGGVGFSYIFAWIFSAAYAGIRMKKSFGVALQGRTHIDFGDPFTTFVNTRLLPGWYLLFVAGALLLALAIFRDKITGDK